MSSQEGKLNDQKVSDYVSALKVEQLKNYLKKRGLDTIGKKADLAKRLQDAMIAESESDGLTNAPIKPENGNEQSMEQEVEPVNQTSVIQDEEPSDFVKSEVNQPDVDNPFEQKQQEDEVADNNAPEPDTDKQYPPTEDEESFNLSVTDEKTANDDKTAEINNETEETQVNPEGHEVKIEEQNIEDSETLTSENNDKPAIFTEEPKSKLEHTEPELPPLDKDTVDEDDLDITFEMEEDTYCPPEDTQLIFFDRNNADLHFKVLEGGLTAFGRQEGPFQYLWGGARASRGIREGKFAYECKIDSLLDYTFQCEVAAPDPGIRIGWSKDFSTYMLGGGYHSYAYENNGTYIMDKTATPYGEEYTAGDVITALINFDTQTPEFCFLKNGKDLGVVHKMSKDSKDTLFPHVSCRQFKVTVNFGNTQFVHELPEGFSPLKNASNEQLTPSAVTAEDEKEVLMMIGLPGSGKSRWIEKFLTSNTSKRYHILSESTLYSLYKPEYLLYKSDVSNKGYNDMDTYESDRSYRTDNTVPCLNKLLHGCLQLAAKQPRNYIIDQSNIFKTTQQRKSSLFSGFKRCAIIMHPYDNYLFFRQKQVQHKIPPQPVLNQYKIAFHLPEDTEFDEVRFPELPRERVIKSLAGDLQFAPKKRYAPRGGMYNSVDRRDFRGSYRRSGPYRHGGYSPYGGGDGYGYSAGYGSYRQSWDHFGQGYGGYGGGFQSYGQYSRGGSYRGGNYSNKRPSQSGYSGRGSKRPRD